VSEVWDMLCHRLAPILAFSVFSAVLAGGRAPDLQTRIGGVELLTNTQGVDFRPYLLQSVNIVLKNWAKSIPESINAPVRMKGKVAIEFAVKKDGHVTGIKLAESSGNSLLDRAAWAGIYASGPWPPLPTEFNGDYIALRIRFEYNQPPEVAAK